MTPEAKEKAWAKRLWDNYKLIPKQYYAILEFQSGVCFLCMQAEPVPGRRLCVDHDHETGEIRGLLCSRCNPVIGKLERAYKRFALHKTPGLTMKSWAARFGAYMGLTRRVADIALGGPHFGYIGQVGTKAHRIRIKRDKKRIRESVHTIMDTKNASTL